MNLESGDRIKLSDGHSYLFLFSLPLHGKKYLVFASEDDDEAFRIGRYVKKDGEQSIAFVFDEGLLTEICDYISQHPDAV